MKFNVVPWIMAIISAILLAAILGWAAHVDASIGALETDSKRLERIEVKLDVALDRLDRLEKQ